LNEIEIEISNLHSELNVNGCSFSLCLIGFRFACFGSKCSLTDTDVHLDHVTTDEDEGQGRGVVEPLCPVPFVKLKTDILETESLNLLSEATFVDTLLTTLPVGFFY